MHCHVMDNHRILSANALPDATTGVRTLARGTPPAQSPIAPRSIRAAGDGGRYFIGQLKGVAVERHHVKSRGDAWVKTRPSQWNDVRRAWRSYGDRSHLNRGARETAFALRDPSPPSPLARASQPRAAPSARHCGFVTPSRGDSWSGPLVSRTEKTSQSQQPKPNRPIRFTRKKNSEYGGDINARNR
jgi:hypothetical protein